MPGLPTRNDPGGVVASVKQYGLGLHTPLQYFLPFAQDPRGTAHVVLRAELPASVETANR